MELMHFSHCFLHYGSFKQTSKQKFWACLNVSNINHRENSSAFKLKKVDKAMSKLVWREFESSVKWLNCMQPVNLAMQEMSKILL